MEARLPRNRHSYTFQALAGKELDLDQLMQKASKLDDAMRKAVSKSLLIALIIERVQQRHSLTTKFLIRAKLRRQLTRLCKWPR